MGKAASSSAQPAPARGPELRGLLAWIVESWWRPAGSAAAWEQRAGHERATSHPVAPPSQDTGGQPDPRNAASGSKVSQSQ